MSDIRIAARSLGRSPAFTTAAVLTLALATGATTAIFAVVDGVLLRPLPFSDPERLVQVYGRSMGQDRAGTTDPVAGPVGSAELEAFLTESTTLESLTGYSVTTRHLEGPDGLERLTGVVADLTFFDTLGVHAAVGRTFRPGDPSDVVVISESLWQRQFTRDPGVAGRTVRLDGRPVTILGVMPDTFQYPYSAASLMAGALPESRTDVWMPLPGLRSGPDGALRRGRVSVTARLRPGVSPSAGAAELAAILRRLESAPTRETTNRLSVRLVPLSDDVVAPVRRSLWLLFAAVGLVLAAAGANVANLLVARAVLRRREVAIRAALGADRFRLVRVHLSESLLLALAGGILGIVVAWWGTRLLLLMGSALIPRAHDVVLDWRMFAFLVLASGVMALAVGLIPAFSAAGTDPADIARGSGGHGTAGPRSSRARDLLVVAEIAMAFVLALGAAVVIREVLHLQRVETGMVTTNVLTAHLTPSAPAADYYGIEARVASLPGVAAAGFTQLLPLQNWGWESDVEIRGRSGPSPIVGLRYVTPGYFRALGIPVVRGRAFDHRDGPDAPRVVLVNEAFERAYIGGRSALGLDTNRGVVVGVVGDVRNVRLDRTADPELYYPAAQNVTMAPDIGMTLVARVSGRPEASVAAAVRSAIRDVNPNLAVFKVKTMDEVLADSTREVRLYGWVVGLFAALALSLSAIGIYGVIAYTAAARTREFAIRMALGGGRGEVAGRVMSRAFRLGGIGVVVGASAAAVLVVGVGNVTFGARPDLSAFAGVGTTLLVVALAAATMPALRVARISPARALRQE
jgi:predicted permease